MERETEKETIYIDIKKIKQQQKKLNAKIRYLYLAREKV